MQAITSEPTTPQTPSEERAEPPATFRAGHPGISRLELVAVGAGGAMGALLRIGADQAWPSPVGGWPWAMLAVNIAGALLLGCLMTALRHGPLSIPAYRLLGTGLCGALTTFSTLQLQLLQMLEHAHGGPAVGYLGASVAGGYAAVSLAVRITRRAVRAGAATDSSPSASSMAAGDRRSPTAATTGAFAAPAATTEAQA